MGSSGAFRLFTESCVHFAQPSKLEVPVVSSLLTMENNEKMPAASSSILMPVLIKKCTLLMQLIVKTVIHSFLLQELAVH